MTQGDIFISANGNSSSLLRRRRMTRIAAFSNTNSDSSVGSGNITRTVANARDARKTIDPRETQEENCFRSRMNAEYEAEVTKCRALHSEVIASPELTKKCTEE
jgi:hypothetical protein